MRFEFLPDGLAAALVGGIGGADKISVGDIETSNELFEFGGVLVGESLGVKTKVGGFGGVFIAVFVGAGRKADFMAFFSVVARENVS
jgi:hypothetical protein